MTVLAEFSVECCQRVDAELSGWLAEQNTAERLMQAMRYSVLSGGKRIRPILVYAAAECFKTTAARLDACDVAAAAVECIHAYSLIHDDLPAMDDDALRRGRATCHIAFDEATAILAGDCLQALAFEKLSTIASSETAVLLVRELAYASGGRGMVAGQMLDLLAEGQSTSLSLEALEKVHRHKTGALIRASVRMGAMAAGANAEQLRCVTRYAEAIGLAFQVQDDIIDITSDSETLGKAQGADIAKGKSTYVSLLGLPAAEQKTKELLETAKLALSDFGQSADPLRALADYIVSRQR